MSAFGALLTGLAHALPAWLRWVIALLCSYLLLFHIYIGVYGPPTNHIFLSVHLCIALALLFLMHPLKRRSDEALNAWSAVDLACVAATLLVLAYLLASLDTWEERVLDMRPIDIVAGIVFIAIVVEAVRRTVGWAMIVLCALFAAHALFADRFPGPFYGPRVAPKDLLNTLFIGDNGIFGVPVLVMAQYVVLFLLFGRLLQATGAGAFFTRIAFAFFGHRVGGPAKAAVVSSGLFGTVSGSGVSNVLTTGSFTIPMMARLGYRPAFAGGVEASAAVGGAIMPPVMGAVAFMMAEFMGVSYASIALAAAIPALLYYFAIYCTVHLEAKKYRLQTLRREDLPKPWHVMARQGYLLLPLLLIIAMLMLDYSIVLVALVTSLGTVLVSLIRPETRLSPVRIAEAIEFTGRTATTLSATCACAGIIIGSIFATGLSYQLAQIVVGLAQNQLWLLLILSALIALVLGTGLTASAVYITMVATVIPLLKAAGVGDMGAHMFAFYYGVVSDITPPTALAAVAAAGIARANPMRTMVEASRIGIAAFIVPFTFIAQPALLMRGTLLDIATATLTAGLGLFALAAALAGYLGSPLGALRRTLFLAAAALLIGSDKLLVDAVGILVLIIACAPDFLPRRAETRVLLIDTETSAPRGWFTRWIERRAAQEAEENAELLARAGGAADNSLEELKRALVVDEAKGESPRDFGCWLAWAVIFSVAFAIGALGANHAHARAPLAWLGWLAAATVFLVAGLRLALRPVFNAEKTAC